MKKEIIFRKYKEKTNFKISRDKVSIKMLRVLCFVLLLIIVYPSSVRSFTLTSSDTVVITAQVGENVVNSKKVSGGMVLPTTINFSGTAYPSSKVYILKDGHIVMTTKADGDANFSVPILGLTANTYIFSIYTEDPNGVKSADISFPIFLSPGTTININNIFLSPTINLNKYQVKKGDNLVIFGQGDPNSEIIISVSSNPQYYFKVISDGMGFYYYNFDTSILDVGKYQARAKSVRNNKSSLYSSPVAFTIGEERVVPESIMCSLLKGDLNCDGRVNLTDFSIMSYWYKKTGFPIHIDLNNDGAISLVDFSIMAHNWTD